MNKHIEWIYVIKFEGLSFEFDDIYEASDFAKTAQKTRTDTLAQMDVSIQIYHRWINEFIAPNECE